MESWGSNTHIKQNIFFKTKTVTKENKEKKRKKIFKEKLKCLNLMKNFNPHIHEA